MCGHLEDAEGAASAGLRLRWNVPGILEKKRRDMHG